MTHEEFNKNMGRAIRVHRIIRGVTLQWVGARIGISYQQVQKYETGANALSAYQLMRVAEALGVPVLHLLAEASLEVSGVPERTFHRSLRFMRCYQRLNEEQQDVIAACARTMVLA